MPENLRQLSNAELDALKVIWDRGPSPVREVLEALRTESRDWAYTTAKTILDRLEKKGYVERDQSDPAHVYHATISRAEFGRRQMREIRESVFEGEGIPLVRALVQGARLSQEEISALRASLDDLDRRPGRIS